MPPVKKFTERIDLPVPKGTKARAAKAAALGNHETVVAYCRRKVLDAIETDLRAKK